MKKKRICVSACMLGVPCRWKGDSKPRQAALELAARGDVEVVPFCLESAAGLGCPREPIELVENPAGGEPRVKRVDRSADVTDALRRAAEAQVAALAKTGGADGFLLKAKSPSCGLAAPLHREDGSDSGAAAPGAWAAAAMAAFPDAWFGDEHSPLGPRTFES